MNETDNPGVNDMHTAADCTGAYGCEAQVHVHGCFNDDGNCTEPDDRVAHPRVTWPATSVAESMVRLVIYLADERRRDLPDFTIVAGQLLDRPQAEADQLLTLGDLRSLAGELIRNYKGVG